MLGKVRLDDGAVGGLQVGLGALVESAAAHAGQSFGQRLLGDVIVQTDGGIVQQLHGAVDFGVDVVVVGAGVLHQIQHIFLCCIRLRHGIHLFVLAVARFGDGGQPLRLGPRQGVFQDAQIYAVVSIISHSA